MPKRRSPEKELLDCLASFPEFSSNQAPIIIINSPDRVMVPVNSRVLADFKRQFRYWQRHIDKALRAYMTQHKKDSRDA